MAQAVSPAGSPGDEKSSFVSAHNDRKGLHGKAGGAPAAASTAASVSTAAPPFIIDIAKAVAMVASRLSPPTITRTEIDGASAIGILDLKE